MSSRRGEVAETRQCTFCGKAMPAHLFSQCRVYFQRRATSAGYAAMTEATVYFSSVHAPPWGLVLRYTCPEPSSATSRTARPVEWRSMAPTILSVCGSMMVTRQRPSRTYPHSAALACQCSSRKAPAASCITTPASFSETGNSSTFASFALPPSNDLAGLTPSAKRNDGSVGPASGAGAGPKGAPPRPAPSPPGALLVPMMETDHDVLVANRDMPND